MGGDGPGRPVLLVFDVTPHTRRGRTVIEEGLAALERKALAVPAWSVAALGGKPSKPGLSATDLGATSDRVLKQDTDVVSTLTALAKTLKAWREKDGVVVYVADWHFEDDVDLEGFIQALRKKGRTLSVVGTEAAFRRGWNDGLRDGSERFELDVRGTAMRDYWDGVGRDPFGGRDKQAPWHGGDTAYPYAPYRWADTLWESAFSLSDWDLAEDDAGLGALFGGSAEQGRDQRAPGRGPREIGRIDERLAQTGLDDATRAELEARREALDREREQLMRDLAKSFGGGCRGGRASARSDWRHSVRERAQVIDELGDLLQAIVDADDDAEEARLEAKQASSRGRARPAHGGDRAARVLRTASPPDGGVPDPEELKGRLPDGTVPDDLERPEWIDTDDVDRRFPLPSSFGPYGLMRAAGVTGGRYVLFSWNPSGRKTVQYEYSRCNLFPPDLRSRKAILRDLRDNPWARSMLAAWWTLAKARVEVLEQLPPLRENLRSACRMDRTPHVAWIPTSWDGPGEQKQCVRLATQAAEVLDQALKILDGGLADGGEPQTDIDQRHHAEALLFRHAVRVARFELRETADVAKDVKRSAFKKKNESPGIHDESWVRRGGIRRRCGPGRTPRRGISTKAWRS